MSINSTKSVIKSRNQTIRYIQKYIDQHIDEYNNFFTFKKRKIRCLITQSLQNGFLGFTHHGVLTSGEMGVSGLVGFKEVDF